MKLYRFLALSVVLTAACGTMSLVSSSSKPSTSSVTPKSASTDEDDDKPTTKPASKAAATSDKSESKGGGSETTARSKNVPAIEANLVKLLGDETRWSASGVQGTPSPMCPVNATTKRMPVSVLSLDNQRRLDCFSFNDNDGFSKPEKFTSIRDFQDHGELGHSTVVLPTKKSDAVGVFVTGGTFYAIDESSDVQVLAIPCEEKAKGIDGDFVVAHFDAFCDAKKGAFDVFTVDAAKAKTIKLPEAKEKLLAKALVAAKEKGEAMSKADAEKLKGVKFPAAVGVDDSAAAIQATKDHIAAKKKTEIDPAQIKKAAVTSTWNVSKTSKGFLISRIVDVTVGFARTDAYAIDPNKKCAIATFEIKEEYEGSKWGSPYATGMATGWTNISCDRLK